MEFISQIGNDTHTYLQLGTRDALLFVYKKSIFEFGSEHREQKILSKKYKFILNIFETLSSSYYILINNILSNDFEKSNTLLHLNINFEKFLNNYKDLKSLDSKAKILFSFIRFINCKQLITDFDFLIKKIKKTKYTICEIETNILKEYSADLPFKNTLDRIL